MLIIPIVILLDAAVLFVSYRLTYDNQVEVSTDTIERAAEMAEIYMELNYPDTVEKGQEVSGYFYNLCAAMGISYIYAIAPDAENDSMYYVAIGFGDGASDQAKKDRYPGVTVNQSPTKEMMDACSGDGSGVIEHYQNQFGDMVAYYLPVTEYYDYDRREYVKPEKPVVVAAEENISSIVERIQRRIKTIAVFTILFSMLIVVLIFLLMYFRISKPITRISRRMKNFVSDRDKGVEKLKVKGHDELAEMSQSFNMMTDEIDGYIRNIDALNREKHMQDAELNIARKIQSGLLKPSFYRDGSVELRAFMHEAKNVGGDLYDYQTLDDGRVFICIADVSGKGISAALFMSRAITLLHQYALLGYTPAQMLKEYNHTLAEQNPNGLFITTLAAVYDPKTNELTYSNAGHNHPYLISDTLIELDGAAGIAAGIFDGMDYEQETIALKDGDVVFLYTDGVNEAEDNSGKMYGTEALEAELKKFIGVADGDICDAIMKSVKAFSDGADQSDDITILTLKAERSPVHCEITVKNQVENLTKINEIINAQRLDEETRSQLLLIAEELFVNICFYAYKDKQGEITFAVDRENDRIILTFTDAGEPFDPTADVINIEEYDHENSTGGLGLFMVFEMADDYSYTYEDGKNRIKVIKKI
ncbi:MAG: SpoIIE family protein phosphatase [Ruminococcus sp.]|nr:SpoIIE family protein phosphatase [Ruminococcus sp.]